TAGALVVLVILPVVLGRVWRAPGTRAWLGLLMLAILVGWLTAQVSLAVVIGREIVDNLVLYQAALLVGLGLLSVGCLWGIRVIGPRRFIALWSAGAITAFLLTGDLSNNPWKYGLALPVTLLLF